jgi:hypothetical protein
MPKKYILAISRLPSSIARRFVSRCVQFLTNPIKLYSPSEASNLRVLKKRLKVGDVLLISGNARISHVVKILTTSQWSHVVLYVGNQMDKLTTEELCYWSEKYGALSVQHLVIDADPIRGVHLKPLDDSVGLMVRHCRPAALTTEDILTVTNIALAELGKQYDISHIFRLLFFFAFPWELLPTSLRRFVTEFTLSESDTICSRVLSEAFHSVGYPIRPLDVIQNKKAFFHKALRYTSSLKHRGKSAAKLLAGGRIKAAVCRINDKRYYEILLKGTRYVTPADYDLSRFFNIIKDPDDLNIDYKNASLLVPSGKTFDD